MFVIVPVLIGLEADSAEQALELVQKELHRGSANGGLSIKGTSFTDPVPVSSDLQATLHREMSDSERAAVLEACAALTAP